MRTIASIALAACAMATASLPAFAQAPAPAAPPAQPSAGGTPEAMAFDIPYGVSIGCSGGTGDQDAAICKMGADVMK
jgi:glc operon protein GlcG